MLSKERPTVEKMFSLPNSLSHLFRHVVNIVFEGGLIRGDRAHKDFMSVLALFFSFFFFFFYIMYSLLQYKNSHAALAMA